MNKGTFGAFSGRFPVGGSVGVAPIWESPDTGSYTSATHIFWDHNLGFRPKFWQMLLRVITAFDSYTVGMEIEWPGGIDGGPTAGKAPSYVTTTRIGIFSNAGSLYVPMTASAYVFQAVTGANVRPVARIYG